MHIGTTLATCCVPCHNATVAATADSNDAPVVHKTISKITSAKWFDINSNVDGRRSLLVGWATATATAFIVHAILCCHRHSATWNLPHQLNACLCLISYCVCNRECHKTHAHTVNERWGENDSSRVGSDRVGEKTIYCDCSAFSKEQAAFWKSPNGSIVTFYLPFHFIFSVKLFLLRCLGVSHQKSIMATVCNDLYVQTLPLVHAAKINEIVSFKVLIRNCPKIEANEFSLLFSIHNRWNPPSWTHTRKSVVYHFNQFLFAIKSFEYENSRRRNDAPK